MRVNYPHANLEPYLMKNTFTLSLLFFALMLGHVLSQQSTTVEEAKQRAAELAAAAKNRAAELGEVAKERAIAATEQHGPRPGKFLTK